jgi:uncharacterized protein (TIGR03437 family)
MRISVLYLVLTVPCALSQTGLWERRAPYPVAVTEVSGAAINGKIYMLCGLAEGPRPVALNVYDPVIDSWSRRADIPIGGGADHCNVAAVGGKLYLLGAIRIGSNFTDGGTYQYDPGSDRWEKIADMPTPRGASGVAVVGSRIYVAGGLNGSNVTNNFDVFDTVTRQWSVLPAMANRRDHLTAQAVGTRFYAISGRDAASAVAAVEEYDTESGIWRTRAPIPIPRGGIGSGVVNGKIVVFGGEGNTGRPEGTFEEVHEYDPVNNTWRSLENMLTPRHGLYGVVVDERIFVPGGGHIAGANFSNAHEVFYLPPVVLPRMFPDGVRNAASLTLPLAPGSIITVFGERLSQGERIPVGIGVPSRLNAVELRLENQRLPLYYVSPGQINAHLPYDLPIRQLTLTVYNADHPGAAYRTPALVDHAPGIFSVTGDGQGQGAILIGGTGLIARPPVDAISRPARRGETIEIYCAGLGRIENAPPPGEPTPASPLFRTPGTPIVTIGGARANVLFSGLAPGFVGAYQVNAVISQSAMTGAAVPVSLRMGENGPESNTVTIAIE